MAEENKLNYTKIMTPDYFEMPEEIIFDEQVFTILQKEEALSIEELERLRVIDVNKYKKSQLQNMLQEFVTTYDYPKLKKEIQKIKMNSVES